MIWNKVSIGEFLEERKDRFKPEEANNLKLKRISKIDFSGNIHINENKPTKTNMILIKSGDLVISGINADKGAVSIYTGDEDVMATIHYSSYSFDSSRINIDYLKWYLKSKTFLKILKEQTKGGIKTELKAKKLLPLVIDLPDLSGQKEILEKIESINVECNDICDLQSELLLDISQLKQAILQEAIQGKLTQEWREKNVNVEPASELLKRIKAEKEQLIKNKRLKKGNTINHPRNLIELDSFPISWEQCKADEILFVTKLAGFEYSKHITLEKTGEIPVIRAQNVRPLEIDKSNLLFIDKKTSELLDRCSLTKECLLVTFIGAGIGDVATYNENRRWHLAPNVAKMEPFEGCEEFLDIKFLNYFLLSPVGRKEIFKHIKATAQPSLSMGTIRDIDFLIPPIQEQKEIVEKVETLMQKCNELEQEITQSEEHANMLMQAVLKEAFESKTENTEEYANA
ncbi:restriction endonuclease subunit S [Cellulophaga lytica]|uniref:restriction endonuclease subunit S n=1 Tax=Cellulophaga lytica TaxID=979 RepID=UPI0026E1C679|nr:restriction endonuclease subunit S [Cellulophaga lytica]MDO6852395.1 restriction endonuclease subunit S [Cellulophaga lytica]